MNLKKSIVNLSVAASLVAATASIGEVQARPGLKKVVKGVVLRPVKTVRPGSFKPKKVRRGRMGGRRSVIVTCG